MNCDPNTSGVICSPKRKVVDVLLQLPTLSARGPGSRGDTLSLTLHLKQQHYFFDKARYWGGGKKDEMAELEHLLARLITEL